MKANSTALTAMFGVVLYIVSPRLSAQTLINNNREQLGDFKGLDQAQAWSVDLAEQVNTLRFEIESPTATLSVLLDSPNGNHVTLFPADRKGVRVGWSVLGRNIEASPARNIKLAPGRYMIRVAPKKGEFAGAYTIKLLEPSFRSRDQAESGSPSRETSAELKELERQRDEIDKKIEELKRAQKAKTASDK